MTTYNEPTMSLDTPAFSEYDDRINSLIAFFLSAVKDHPGIPAHVLRHVMHDSTAHEFGLVEKACLSTGVIRKTVLDGSHVYQPVIRKPRIFTEEPE